MLFGMDDFGNNKFATPNKTYTRGVWTEICSPKTTWSKIKPQKTTIKRCKPCQ